MPPCLSLHLAARRGLNAIFSKPQKGTNKAKKWKVKTQKINRDIPFSSERRIPIGTTANRQKFTAIAFHPGFNGTDTITKKGGTAMKNLSYILLLATLLVSCSDFEEEALAHVKIGAGSFSK